MVKVPDLIRSDGALRGGVDAIGVGGGLLLLVALVQGKALDVFVLPPLEVLLPHAASNKGSITSATPNSMLIGACCHLLLKEKDTIKPPVINKETCL